VIRIPEFVPPVAVQPLSVWTPTIWPVKPVDGPSVPS
jgi:hypothetical protein